MTRNGDRFRLGINYWPRSSGMYAWQAFDIGEWREDFSRIAALGLEVVRFFLMWEHVQPGPREVDRIALDQVAAVMDALADSGLRGMPTLFCGHMSGVNWLPAWTLDPRVPHGRFRTITLAGESPFGIGDFYADPALLAAQRLFCARVAGRIGAHPALFAWDLGNEFSNLRDPAHPFDAREWSRSLTGALRARSAAPVTGGTHGEDLERDRRLRLSSLCDPWEFATMHGYSVYSAFARDRLDTNVVPFLFDLAGSFARKRVLFSEFGNPTCPPGPPPPYACLNENELADYGARVLDKLHRAGALGAMWWCWADYVPALAALPPFDRAPHELTFGIVRADGSFKPIAQCLAAFAQQRRTVQTVLPRLGDEEAYYRGLPSSTARAYEEFTACAR